MVRYSYLINSAKTRDYIDLSEECDAAAEICDRVIQSLTDNPFFLDSKVGNRDAGGFLRAIALRPVRGLRNCGFESR